MEALAIIQGVESLISLSNSASQLYRRFKDAPDDLRLVASHLGCLNQQIQLLTELQAEQLDVELLGTETCRLFCEIITGCSRALGAIHNALTECSNKNHSGARLEWAVLGKGKVDGLMLDLARIETTLNSMMTGLQLILLNRRSRADRAHLAEIKADLSALRRLLFQALVPSSLHNNQEKSREYLTRLNRVTELRRLDESRIAAFCNLNGTIVSASTSRQSTYVSSFRLRLPFQLSLCLDVVLQVEKWYWSCTFLDRSHLSLRYMVPPSSAIMVAAAAGDVPEIRRLLAEGLARPNDETVGHRTPLDLAIVNGNVEAVQLLLQEGASANGLFGEKQTSPLAWALQHRHLDIIRLLLSHKASLHHLNIFGWSPLFYLWYSLEHNPSSTELLSLLYSESSEHDFSWLHAGLSDVDGWGVIHRAAIFGTVEDVQTLISKRVDPLQEIGDIGWTTINLVVYYGRYDVFLTLLPYYDPKMFNLPDKTGWTLLHIAAAEGREDIIRHLLQLGVDHNAFTLRVSIARHEELMRPVLEMEGDSETRAHLRMAVDDNPHTAREVAFLHSEANGKNFDHILDDFLDDKTDSEVWVDAVEVLEVDEVVPRDVLHRMRSRLWSLASKLDYVFKKRVTPSR
jgi:ankyrin repeat protein